MRLFRKLREREQASRDKLDEALRGIEETSGIFDELRARLREIQVDVKKQSGQDEAGRPSDGSPKEAPRRAAK